MTEHTRGPWTAKVQSDGSLWIMGGHGSSVYDSALADTWPLSEADARLIAAAPDLLEALEGIEEHARQVLCEITDQDTGWFYQLQAATGKARAAIAKAKGGTS